MENDPEGGPPPDTQAATTKFSLGEAMMNKKHLSSNFTVTTRDEHQFIYRNKTNAPELGKYNPRMHSVDAKPKVTRFKDHQ